MAQTTAAAADLGIIHTAKAIGYRVLNLDETLYSAFSTTGVAETNVIGFYRKDDGVVAPDAGGYIVWGVSGTDYAEDTIPPAQPSAAQIDTQLSGTHGAGAWATATGFATPTNVTDAQTAIIAAQPSAAAVVSAIMAYALETGKTFEQAMLNIWSVTVGDSTANDAQNPTSIVYDDPVGVASVTHTLTDTTRVAS